MSDSLIVRSVRGNWEWAEWIKEQLRILGWDSTLTEMDGSYYLSPGLNLPVPGEVIIDKGEHSRNLSIIVEAMLAQRMSNLDIERIDISRASETESKNKLAEAVTKVFGTPGLLAPHSILSDLSQIADFGSRMASTRVPFPGARRFEAPSQPGSPPSALPQASRRIESPKDDDAAYKPGRRIQWRVQADQYLVQEETPPPNPPVKKDFARNTKITITETIRTEEPIGEEVRTFDQSRTTASSEETISLSHTSEWTATVDTSKGMTVGGTGQAKVMGLGSVQGTIEANLTKRYLKTWKAATSRHQSTKVNVPAGRKVKVTVRWKRIWQEGKVTLRARDGSLVNVPFRVTVGLSFDKQTEDEGS